LIELPIQRLRTDAVLPERAYHGDAGLDEEIERGQNTEQRGQERGAEPAKIGGNEHGGKNGYERKPVAKHGSQGLPEGDASHDCQHRPYVWSEPPLE